MEKHDKPRVSSWPIKCWKLDMLAEAALGEYGDENNKSNSSNSYYYSQFSVESTKPRVSLSSRSSKCWKLNMLAELALGDHENSSNRYFSIESTRPRVSLLSWPSKVNVPRKKRSVRHRSSSSTTRWTTCVIEPKNPNQKSSSCVTVSKKRRSVNVSEEEEMRSPKKRKTVCRRHVLPPTTPSTIPEWLVKVMAREENAHDPKLIIARELFKSDLDPVQARLSMPLNQMVSKEEFLTEEEKRIIDEQSVTKTRSNGVSVTLVDPLLNKHKVDLRKWKMNKGSNYVFVDGWNDVVAKNNSFEHKNNFKVGHVFPVWSFRCGEGKLCFALVPPN